MNEGRSDKRPLHFRGAIDNRELEKQFDRFFESVGFERVSRFVGASPNFENADYIDWERSVVVELKIIDTDYFQDGGIIHRLHSIVPAAVDVNKDGTGIYQLKFPDGRRDGFEEPVHRLVRKANRQVRETIKVALGGKGTGFIAVAANGFRTLSPSALAEMVEQMIRKDADSLNGYLVCYPRLGEVLSDGRTAFLSHTGTGRICSQWQEMLILSLGESWGNFFTAGGHS